jgi:hypothetical protein
MKEQVEKSYSGPGFNFFKAYHACKEKSLLFTTTTHTILQFISTQGVHEA